MNQRFTYLLIIFTFHFSFLFAQQAQIDSLHNLLKYDKEDTNKVNHLNQLGWKSKSIPGNDTVYCIQAIKLAQKLGYVKGICDGYENLGLVYWTKLKDNYRTLSYFSKAEEMYRSSGNLHGEAFIYHYTGMLYFGMDSFNTALKYAFKALSINEKLKNKQLAAAIPDNVGDDYTALGDYPNALKYYLDAFKVIEESGDNKRISNYLENIGTLYSKIGDNKNAMQYFDSSLSGAIKCGYKALQIQTLLDIGSTYKTEKKYSDALEYGNRALQLSRDTKDTIGIAKSSKILGEIYMEQENYDEALIYEKEALKTGDEYRYLPVTVLSHRIIGEIYLKQKKYKEAKEYLLAAIALVHGSHELEEEKNDELDLSRVYAATGELNKSLANYARYDSLKDVLFNRDKSRQIGRIEAKADYDKQLSIQHAEDDKAKAIADAKSNRQQIINLLITLLAIIIAIVAGLIYRSWKVAKKDKILMELKALRAQMNPHFIFNAINSIQHSILKNDSDLAHKHLNGFSLLIRKVLENSKYQSISLSEEIEMLKLYVELEYIRYSPKFIYEFEVECDLLPENILISPMLIQPYVENAIWHGLTHLMDKKGKLYIGIIQKGNNLKCIIDDNGIGRKRSLEIKERSIHKSMGLFITNEIVDTLNILHHNNIHLDIVDKMDEYGVSTGTRVELSITLNLRNNVAYA